MTTSEDVPEAAMESEMHIDGVFLWWRFALSVVGIARKQYWLAARSKGEGLASVDLQQR